MSSYWLIIDQEGVTCLQLAVMVSSELYSDVLSVNTKHNGVVNIVEVLHKDGFIAANAVKFN